MRYNLYYLFKEDQEKNPLDPTISIRLLQKLEQLYQQRPPDNANPPPTPDPPDDNA